MACVRRPSSPHQLMNNDGPTFSFFQIEDFRLEIQRKEQDLVQMQAKMKTVEEQHADYQRHIAVLKESLIAKEEHYNMLQIDVSVSTIIAQIQW